MKVREIDYVATQLRQITSDVETAFDVPPKPDLDKQIIKAIQNGTAAIQPAKTIVQLALEDISCSCSRYSRMSDIPLKSVFKEPASYRDAVKAREKALKAKESALVAVRDKAQEIIDGVNLGQYDEKHWRQPITDLHSFIKSLGGNVK